MSQNASLKTPGRTRQTVADELQMDVNKRWVPQAKLPCPNRRSKLMHRANLSCAVSLICGTSKRPSKGSAARSGKWRNNGPSDVGVSVIAAIRLLKKVAQRRSFTSNISKAFSCSSVARLAVSCGPADITSDRERGCGTSARSSGFKLIEPPSSTP